MQLPIRGQRLKVEETQIFVQVQSVLMFILAIAQMRKTIINQIKKIKFLALHGNTKVHAFLNERMLVVKCHTNPDLSKDNTLNK